MPVQGAQELLKTLQPVVEEKLAKDLLPASVKANRFTIAKLLQIERRRRKATTARRGFECNR